MVLLSNRLDTSHCEYRLTASFDTSHCEYRLTASFDRSHPSSHILLCLHCYVPLHPLTHAIITTAAEAEIPQARKKPIEDSHAKSSAFTSKKSAIIAVVCSQSRRSASSSFSPGR